MATKEEELKIILREAVKEARAILEHAEEAVRLFNSGDSQAAAEIVALSHYKVSAYNHCKNDLLERFEDLGIVPGEG